MGIFDQCFDVFQQPAEEPMLHWCMRNVKTADGRPFDHWTSPHLGAPGGPMEAFQDPLVREVYEMFGTRLAKTTFGLMAMIYVSAVQPSPCMFTSATRRLVEEIIGDRAWKMIAVSNIFDQLPPEARRPKQKIYLPRNRWDSGWAESPATLADKSIKVLHGNEIAKWRYLRGTNEAHPWPLAKERCKEHPDKKIIGEGSPTVQGKCPLEREYLSGWGCKLNVPCPRCIRFQELRLGKGDKGGIIFDKPPSGRLDERLAMRTARYACLYCGAELRNDVRAWMMTRGVWVPDGCTVDHDAAAKLFDGLPDLGTHHDHPSTPYRWDGWAAASWIRGEPTRDGEIASFQLSSLYSLALGWGDIAAEFAKGKTRPATMRNFVNSWLADTWVEKRQAEPWEDVCVRIMRDYPRQIVPLEFTLLGLGVDVQSDHFVYHVVAAGRPRRFATIDYGTAETLEEIFDTVLLADYEHQDGGPPLIVRRSLIDTGFDPADDEATTIHAWARKAMARLAKLRRRQTVRGCKGANQPLGMPYSLRTLGKDTTSPGAQYYLVDPDFTHSIVDRALYGAAPEAAGGWSLFKAEPWEHEDFVRQMMNDAPTEVLDKRTNEPRRQWQRINTDIPNDYRAAGRYAVAALLAEMRNGEAPARAKPDAQQQDQTQRRPEPPRTGLRTADGRPFCILDRR